MMQRASSPGLGFIQLFLFFGGTLIILGTACRGGNAPGSIKVPPPPSAPDRLQAGRDQTPDGLVLRGETRFVGPAADTIETAVTLTNPSLARVRVRLGPCPLHVRVHTMQHLQDAPLWDSGPKPNALDAACRAQERWVELPPGGSVSPDELRLRIPVGELAAHTRLFSVVHYFAAAALINDRSVQIPAGELRLPYVPRAVETVEGLTFHAETNIVEGGPEPFRCRGNRCSRNAETNIGEGGPRRLRTQVTIKNHNNHWVRVEYDACSANLRAYRPASRSGKPVWEHRLLPARDPKTGMYGPGCDLYGSLAVIPPGKSHVLKRFQLEPTVREVLGDSLPPGRYFFTAVFETTVLRFVTPELPSGSAVLAR